MVIREIKREDADEFIRLIKKVESQADFMLMEPGERQITAEQQRQHLARIEQQTNSSIFVAEHAPGNMVGYLMAVGGNAQRARHCAYLVIGILEKYRGIGIGTSLFQQLEEWAAPSGISRLELTVVTENKAGIALYKKRGFEIEGIKRKSLKIDDVFYNEYYMSKLL